MRRRARHSRFAAHPPATKSALPTAMAIVTDAESGMRAAPKATIVQLRAPSLSTRETERQALLLVASCPVPVLISSRCDLALACNAAGVNLPERDIPTGDARRLMGNRQVGRSVHSLAGALEAASAGDRGEAGFVQILERRLPLAPPPPVSRPLPGRREVGHAERAVHGRRGSRFAGRCRRSAIRHCRAATRGP